MNRGNLLEQMIRVEIKYYKRKQELLHRHKMAKYKLETQRKFIHEKLHQWEIVETDKLNSEIKKKIILSYIKPK